MKTETLIRLLSTGHSQTVLPGPTRRHVHLVLSLSVGLSLMVFLFGWSVLDDIVATPLTAAYALKTALGLTTALLASRAWAALRNSRLDLKTGVQMVAPAVLPVVVLCFSTVIVARDDWSSALAWQAGVGCVLGVWLIGAPLWSALIWQARKGLPTQFRLTGAASGLMASGFGVSVFALGCAETAPSYIAVWYGLALVSAAAASALAAPRLLRW